MTSPGQFMLSPDAQPIVTFIEAASKVIQEEINRAHQLWRYDPLAAESHEAWMRLHEECKQRILYFGPLGAEAIRAGRLANATVRTGELVRQVMDLIRSLEGWVSEWWDCHGDGYRAWRKRHWAPNPEGIVKSAGTCKPMPPEFIDDALPLIRPASDALSDLTNEFHTIAIAVPFPDPQPATPVSGAAGAPGPVGQSAPPPVGTGEEGYSQRVAAEQRELKSANMTSPNNEPSSVSPAEDSQGLQGRFLTVMRDGSSCLFDPSGPGVKHLQTITNTAHTDFVCVGRPELGVELALYEAPGPKFIALSWDGPRTGRVLQGREVTAVEAAAEFLKDGLPIPAKLPLPAGALSPVQRPGDGEVKQEAGIAVLRDRAAREYSATGGRFWLAAFPADLDLGRCGEHDSACGTVAEGRIALPWGRFKFLGGVNLEGCGAFTLLTFTLGNQPPVEWQRFLSFAEEAGAALVADPPAWAQCVRRAGNPAVTWVASLMFVPAAAAAYIVEKPGGCRLIVQPWAASLAALRDWHAPSGLQSSQHAAVLPGPSSTMEVMPATPPAEHLPSASEASMPEIDLEAQAIALLFQQPDLSILQITEHLKVDRRTPYKWDKFRKAAEAAGKLKPRGRKDGTLHRGHKTSDGQLEAYARDDEDE